jgi:acyl-coenzyme A thioesterase PaaI-like protein
MTALTVMEEADHVEVADNPQKVESELHHGATRTPVVDASHLPDWVEERRATWGEELQVLEWQDDDGTYRNKNGWRGTDLVHDKRAPVRVIQYFVQYGAGIVTAAAGGDNNNKQPQILCERGGVGTTLTGVAHFTPRAESHKGFCHGGSMTSLMDDVIGWVAFLVTGECKPWTGFTVQVNSSLKRPIPVDSVLLVRAKITAVERRKVSVEASIFDPNDDDAEHASGTGLVVMNKGVLPQT